ncbi:MAG: RpiB/LacA/LacB family sugar-phosphate isomerase [Methylococcaceae bacterium]
MKKLKIGVACDHAGFERKQAVLNYLQNQGIEYKDFGAYSAESSDYADFAHPLARAVSNAEFDLGVTLCGSGNGINMTANKHQGIRSAICWMPEIAALARQHNDANICALPARYITDVQAVEIVRTFLSSEFEGGRHQRRIDKIPC